MASNTMRSVSSTFVAILCMALVLCTVAEDASSSMESKEERSIGVPANRNYFNWDDAPKKDECDCVCGVGRNNRIVGGTRAGKSEFPWLVAMFKRGSFYCGGSLITDRHVLSAAHCFVNVNSADVQIALGAYDVSDPSERFLIRSVRKVTSHPDFNIAISYDSDVAVVELDRPVTFGAWNIGTACLPSGTYREYDGEYATVAGRGRTREGGSVSPIPLKVDVPLMTMRACRQSEYASSKITDNMLCGGFPEGARDACQGDSGGPLNFRMNNTTMSTMELIGVVSWGKGCARPDLPGVYTRIQKFVPWIRRQITGACECTPV